MRWRAAGRHSLAADSPKQRVLWTAIMPHLFSPLTVGGVKLINRVVMAPYPSGCATQDGSVDDALYDYYLQRAHGSVGLIITEPARVIPPVPGETRAHFGLYDDGFIPRLKRLSQAVHGTGSRLLVMLDAPSTLADATTPELGALAVNFLRAAWRAQEAGCDGIALSAADSGVLHLLTSPLTNKRTDRYGGNTSNRLRMPLEIIEGVRTWLGPKFLIAFRMVAEEFAPEGITFQDARVNARRLVAAGTNLLDVMTDTRTEVAIAQFPGWRVPLASGIKRMISDVPVISSGLLGDPHLADSVVRDGSVDLVMLGKALRTNAYWTHIAHIVLASSQAAQRSGGFDAGH
jgi:2,4-dienoyl-CoA reductase-like NADH-dependent reductase (Old Yellow Enzyme family)